MAFPLQHNTINLFGVHGFLSFKVTDYLEKPWVIKELVVFNVKLISTNFRWRIVVHGGIDGFSRLPDRVYLFASSNNKAATVFRLFGQAVEEYGLPSRVRSDKSGENYDVGRFMLNHPSRGPGQGSIIAGNDLHGHAI